MASGISAGVTSFIALLAVALLVSLAAERVRLPAAVLLVAVGAAAGSIWHLRPPFAFGPAVFFVFLPPLIFEAAWSIDLRFLPASAARIAFLAIPGTIFCAVAVAGASVATGVLPFGPALLLGAIVSATDPVAVVAVFRTAAVPAAVKTLVEAESLANDGVAVVIYGIAFALVRSVHVDWPPAIGMAAVTIAAGIAIGAACAIPLWLVLRSTRAFEHEVTATIVLAYLSYLLADRVHGSGIFATAASAITLRALLQRASLMDNRDTVNDFWTSVAAIANATVFLVTGLLIDIPRALNEPLLVVTAVAAVLLSRGVIAAIAGRNREARITIFLAGMRGALPLALALALPEGAPYRAAVIDAVFAVVLVTLVVQGAVLEPVIARLYDSRADVDRA